MRKNINIKMPEVQLSVMAAVLSVEVRSDAAYSRR